MSRLAAGRALAVLALAGAAALAGLGIARALGAPPPAGVQARALAIETGLRCPVCQGLSVASSPSTIAAGMRQIIVAQVRAGRSPAQVRGYFTARYGPWILLDPPRRGIGWLVWLAPPAGLASGLGGIGWLLRRRKRGGPAGVIPPDAEARAAVDAACHSGHGLEDDEVAAALALLTAVREDPASSQHAEAYAIGLAAAALAAAARPPAAAHPAPALPAPGPGDEGPLPAGPAAGGRTLAEADPPPRAPGPAARRRLRRLALPLAANGFAAALAVALIAGLHPRAPGTVPTGTFAGSGAGPLAALRADAAAHPRDPSAWLALGLASDDGGNLAQAYQDYSRAAALDPAALQPRLLLGSVLIRGGSPAEAVRLLTPLLASHPGEPPLLLALGLAQKAAGDPHAAAMLRRYLQLDPSGPQAAQVRALLASR
jgi:cytochrome c-type biogenesis protein CcmH